MTLYILKYNNYYNRLVKSETTLDEYVSYLIYPETDIGVIQAVNFNPNDGVNTQHVIGVGDYDGSGDYLLAVDENDEIVSRWFIIDTVRTRAGQYQLSLRRDLVVDYYNVIIQSPMFIEKATLPYSSPLLFNEENFTVNQIKQEKETLLKDKSNIPWIVGYYSKGSTLQGTVNINEEVDSIPLNIAKIEDWEYYQYKQTELIGPASYGSYIFKYADGSVLSQSYFQAEVNADNGNTNRTQITTQKVQLQHLGSLLSESRFKEAFTSYGLSRLNPSAYSGAETNSKVLDLNSYSGSVVKTLDGKYHQISVNSVQRTNTINISSGELFNQLADIVSSNLGMIGTPDTSTFTYKFTAQYYRVSITELTNLETKYNITNNKLVTTDAPWDIFAIPFGAIKVTMEDNKTLQTNADIGIAAAMAIQSQQSGKVYDIQILPYLPMQELLTTSGFNEIRLTDPRQYSKILDKDDATVGIILNANKSRFNFKISDISDPKFKVAQSNIEKKVRNECDKWRLTSPNYSNYFDFSVQKNGGISYFDIDCEYKPFTPYIHLNPNFSYLYGYDDNSPRGLVLGGDFSISQIIDQWQQYQIQNKNFQNIFDRQIQNMEVTNKYQKLSEQITAITGTVSGTTSGAFAGSAFTGGSPMGAAIGGAVGGIASGIGGLADLKINEILRNEAMDYTKDLFGYQLATIQALPNTISKVSALNNNNKIFPILEYYTCTEEEEKAFINKVAYNGMTVMIIGTAQDYLGNSWEYKNVTDKGYIKGQLIKFNDDGEDFHVVNEIAAELNKGVYIKQ